MPASNLRVLTAVVAVMAAIDAIVTPGSLIWATLAPESFQTHIMSQASEVDGAALGFRVLTMVLFARWIYVAGRNLVAAGYDDLEFSPGSRIWWFAVPVACLFKPFQGMRELWNASHGSANYYGDNHALVSTWWALWLADGFAATIASYLAAQPEGDLTALWVAGVLDILLAVVAIKMIRSIALAQGSLSRENLAEVFA